MNTFAELPGIAVHVVGIGVPERAGKREAAIQSLLETAKLNGIEPAAWLKDALEKLPAWPNRRLDELLPLRPLD